MYEITVKINNDFIDSVNNICSLVYELNSIMEYSIKNGLKYEYCEGAKVNEFKAVINAGKEIDVNIFANIIKFSGLQTETSGFVCKSVYFSNKTLSTN